MWGQLNVYWLLLKAGFWRQSQYRLATLAGLFTNIVFGLVRAAVLLAAVQASGGFAGYSAGTMGAYVWLTQALLGSVQLYAAKSEIADRVHSGDIAVDFIRPVDLQIGHLVSEFGRSAFSLLPRGLPSILIGSVTFGLVLPTEISPYPLGVVSIILAIALSILAQFALGVAGFWIIETRGIRGLYAVMSTFFAGLYLPVHMFPGWLRVGANATPFPSMLQAPIDVLSGYATGSAAAKIIAVQIMWVALLFAAGHVLMRAGRRKLEVQGG